MNRMYAPALTLKLIPATYPRPHSPPIAPGPHHPRHRRGMMRHDEPPHPSFPTAHRIRPAGFPCDGALTVA